MKETMLVVLIVVFLCANLAAQSSVIISTGVGDLCSQSGATTASCPVTSWQSSDSPPSYQGYGTGAAGNAYGVLKDSLTTEFQCNVLCAGGETTGVAGSQFNDTFTFSGLQGAAYLNAKVTMLGVIGGGFVTPSSVEIMSVVQLIGPNGNPECVNNFQTSGPSTGSVRTSCSIKLPISPTDTVTVVGNQSISLVSSIFNAQTAPITQLIEVDLAGKNEGAFYAFDIEDAKGRKIKGATIIAASGTVYPDR